MLTGERCRCGEGNVRARIGSEERGVGVARECGAGAFFVHNLIFCVHFD